MTSNLTRKLFNAAGDRHILRIHAYGTRDVTDYCVHRFVQLGFSEFHEWSEPIPTDRADEYLRLLTKLVRID